MRLRNDSGRVLELIAVEQQETIFPSGRLPYLPRMMQVVQISVRVKGKLISREATSTAVFPIVYVDVSDWNELQKSSAL